MTMLIAEPYLEGRIISERQGKGWDRKDEVWDGVYFIMSPKDVVHQEIVGGLTYAFAQAINVSVAGDVFPGVNVSDRTDCWEENYRCPDVVVLLANTKAQIFEAHISGPADFLVEIVSPGDRAREKLDFYSEQGVREVLIIDRDPWSLELYQHNGSELALSGISSIEGNEVIASSVLPISFQLISAEPRPAIQIVEIGGERTWTA